MTTDTTQTAAGAPVSSEALLAGISRLTLINLHDSMDADILILPNGPDEHGKYSAWLLVAHNLRPLLSTRPMFDTPEAANEMMRRVVTEARRIDPLAEANPEISGQRAAKGNHE